MHPHAAIESAIGTLANTMRLYVESQLRFNELFAIDREEAIDNVDRALEAKLEAFHTLYDVSKSVFPYFDHADTSLLIAMRNAIHHRNHPLFRSLKHRLFLEHRPSKWRGASFLLAAHGTPNGAPPMMSHHFQLADFRARLDPSVSSPYLDITVTADKAQRRADLVEKQLSLAAIDTQATKERYPKDQVYLDLVPIFIFRGGPRLQGAEVIGNSVQRLRCRNLCDAVHVGDRGRSQPCHFRRDAYRLVGG